MIGMNVNDGTVIDGNAHLSQSVADIITTPIGSRLMRRDYGSQLFDLLDQPLNPATRLLIFAAVAIALARWEPRLRLRRVAMAASGAAGAIEITIEGDVTDLAANRHVLLSVPIRTGGIATAN